MRKILSALIALSLLLCCGAFAEVALLEYNFGHFNMTFPEDTIGYIEEEIVNNTPFFMFYQDYDETKVFNKTLNCVWSQEVLDLDSVDPAVYAQFVLESSVTEYAQYGLTATDATLLAADFDEHDGKRTLSTISYITLDYSGAGVDFQTPIYTLQAYVPDEAFGGTYIFTISTDDLEGSIPLMEMMDTISWNA